MGGGGGGSLLVGVGVALLEMGGLVSGEGAGMIGAVGVGAMLLVTVVLSAVTWLSRVLAESLN